MGMRQKEMQQREMGRRESKTISLDSMRHSVLKLSHLPATSSLNSESIAPSVLVAMQRLVAIVAQLRSAPDPDGIDPSHTPETLSLYVFEEAQDVLEAWQQAIQGQGNQASAHPDQGQPSEQLNNQPVTAIESGTYTNLKSQHDRLKGGEGGVPPSWELCSHTPICTPSSLNWDQSAWTEYLELKQLASWLLWGTARSSHTVMRLMEGSSARCLQPDQSWQTGILRLVPLLSLSTTDATYIIDLATHQCFSEPPNFPDVLAADRTIQIDLGLSDPDLSNPDLSEHIPNPGSMVPIAVAELIRTLNQQIRSTTPAIVPFLEGKTTELLMPNFPWQTGYTQLYYALEFFPLSAPALPLLGDPLIRFTNSDWLKQHQALIQDQQIKSSLAELAKLSGGNLSELNPSLLSLPTLVTNACQLSDRLQTGWAMISRRFVTQKLSVSELAVRLHWCLIHSAYEVMQLMSGISATLFCPHASYQSGTLRFLMVLKIQTPELEWILDLATTEVLEMHRSPLPTDAIVQSPAIPWCHQPNLLGQLEAMFWQQVYRAIPEIKLLVQGAEIDLLQRGLSGKSHFAENQEWQPGVIQLQGEFQFLPGHTTIGVS